MSNAKTILMIAGEASGDNHGAQVITAYKAKHPHGIIKAIGGAKMRAAGAEIIFDCAKIAVVGLLEVLKHYKDIKAAWRAAERVLEQDRPDVAVLIDYPGFNLRFAKLCQRYHTKVVYYISPQIWAWKANRIHKIKAYVDHMAVILPFEAAIYEHAGVPVTYVGNPVADELHIAASQVAARQQLHFDTHHRMVGLIPGSRHSELIRLMPILVDTAGQLAAEDSSMEFVVPIADTLSLQVVSDYFNGSNLTVHFIQNNSHLAIQSCDIIIGSSGTITLEAALIGTPMIIIYRMHPLTFALAKRLVQVDHVGLVNIVANERIMPELLQDQACPKTIAKVAWELLANPTALQVIQKKLIKLKVKLTTNTNAASGVANIIDQS